MSENSEKSEKMRMVTYKEKESIIDIMDDVASKLGSDRSAFIRKSVRKELARLSYLPDDLKKALGIVVEEKEKD